MKIVFIAHNLKVAGGLSVGRNIIRTITEIAPMHEYFIIVPNRLEYSHLSDRKNIHILRCPSIALWKRIMWEKVIMIPRIHAFQPDWIFGLGNIGIREPGCRQSLLIHNPHLVYPNNQFFEESKIQLLIRRYKRYKISSVLEYVQNVYCQTEVMKSRFAEAYNYPLKSISLCPNAVSSYIETTNKNDYNLTPAVLNKYAQRFKLFVLTKGYVHKNLQNIVKMYAAYRDALKNTVCILTIQESHHPVAKKVLRDIYENRLDDLIINIGEIPQPELSKYFLNTDALFLPTLLESFSSTYLESMNYGKPIITSDLDFAHEVCGEAALYVDPYSIQSMKDGILNLMDNHEMQNRLINSGNLRKNEFVKDWTQILKTVLDKEQIEHL